jgi:hypothetical protein
MLPLGERQRVSTTVGPSILTRDMIAIVNSSKFRHVDLTLRRLNEVLTFDSQRHSIRGGKQDFVRAQNNIGLFVPRAAEDLQAAEKQRRQHQIRHIFHPLAVGKLLTVKIRDVHGLTSCLRSTVGTCTRLSKARSVARGCWCN